MLTIPQIDLLVVGAGPAGSSAARAAAAKGVRTLLIDAKSRIGEPSHCGEFVPERLFVEHSVDRDCIMNRVECMETRVVDPDAAMGAPSESCSSDNPQEVLCTSEIRSSGFIIDRVRFDRDLARAAASEGAFVLSATRLLGCEQGEWIVSHQGETHTVSPRYVVAADGAASRVAALLGMKRPAFLRGIQVEAPLAAGSDRCLIYLDREFVGGYGWVFPKKISANVGLGTVTGKDANPRALLEAFLKRLTADKIIRPGRFTVSGGLIPVSGMRSELVKDNVLFCGDAAGLTHPITGAGIPQAVVSGTFAGRSVAAAVQSGSDQPLLTYQNEMNAMYKGVLGHAFAKRMLLMNSWSNLDFLKLCEGTWIGFKGYRQRVRS